MDNWTNVASIKNIGLSLLWIIGTIALVVYYCYSYEHTTKKLQYKELSRSFVMYQLLFLQGIVPTIAKTGYIISLRLRGIIHMPQAMWYTIYPFENRIKYFFKLISVGAICYGIYFMTLFIPFNKKCHGYDYNMCTSFRMISIIELIKIIYFVGKSVLYVSSFYTGNTNNQQMNRQKMINALPTTTIPLRDDVCNICLDINENVVWKQLQCGHKFHLACIDVWLRQADTCPICRSLTIKTPDETTGILAV